MSESAVPYPTERGRSSVTATTPAETAEAARGAAGVRVRGLRRRHGAVVALDGIDLDVHAGEVLGLLGPNGAGKTTLMHILAGILKPHGGSVTIGELGAPVRTRTRRAIGLAPQALSLYANLSAEENLRFFCRVLGVRRSDIGERIEEGLTLSGLTSRRHDRAGTFSGGMQRRLNLACALVHHPRLLLLDEPTVGVDPQSRMHLMEAIAGLRHRGLTIVCCTHLLDEAERLCDRVAILDNGHVLDVGTPQQLLGRHAGEDLHGLMLALTGRELRD